MGCGGCFEKQLKIDRLTERIEYLENKLKTEKRKEKEGYFGSSTPSSKKPFKDNAPDNEKKNGGAKAGHKGNGRKKTDLMNAAKVQHYRIGTNCPHCGTHIIKKGSRERTTIDSDPVKAQSVLNICEKGYCPKCKKSIEAHPPVLSRGLYGNRLIANVCIMHYFHGLPMGRIEEVLGENVVTGSLFKVIQRLGRIFKPAIEKIINDYRKAEVRHADETGWRNDGESGYAWIFCTKSITIFRFRDTRSASVVKGLLGQIELKGYLVVDRYAGYNKAPCKIQYCYAHLLRLVQDLGKEFIDEIEVQNFVSALAPQLAEAMHLHNKKITDKQYYLKAKETNNKILKVIDSDACHLGIRNIQQIFRENESRLYHWVDNRNVPADNNRAEKELRPTVIARKVSFGSQSELGAQTREILMTVLHTAHKRLKEKSLEDWFNDALDRIVNDPKIDPYSLLSPVPT
jgi:transposase